MTANPTCFEFCMAVDGHLRRYYVGPLYSSDGQLRQVSIRNETPGAVDGQKIGIDIDPDLFKQFAIPNPETLSRIAIAQAGQDNLFGEASYHTGHMLDFAIEPWEGDLTPVECAEQNEMYIDLDT